jgi:hypothetical protein
MSTAEQAEIPVTPPGVHKHAFPCNPPGGSFLNPGPCACGKTYDQNKADVRLAEAVAAMTQAYGPAFRVGTGWCIAWGGEGANDCAGRLEYDDEAEADEMRQWIDGGIVARQTVIRLPWETVASEEACDGR